MVSKFVGIAIVAFLCGCDPVAVSESNVSPASTPTLQSPASSAFLDEASGDGFVIEGPSIAESECSRLTVRQEVMYRRDVMSRLLAEFPGRTAIFQGVERCRHYVFVFFQLDEEGDAGSMRQFAYDEKTGKTAILGEE